MGLLHQSLTISLGVQLATWVLQYQALMKKDVNSLLRGALWLETIVQVIEACAYFALVFIRDPALMMIGRYVDWFLTTPTMLVSLAAVLYYYQDPDSSWSNFWRKHQHLLVVVMATNTIMLLSGLGVRMGVLPRAIGLTISWIMFLLTFGLLAGRFGGSVLLFFVFVIWSLYGVAEYLPDVSSNLVMNVLDIISKNIFGVLLSLKIMRSSNKNLKNGNDSLAAKPESYD